MQIGMQQISAATADGFTAACTTPGQTRVALARGTLRRPAPDSPATTRTCRRPAPGPGSLPPVTDDEDRRRRDAMMATHHPEGWARPGGPLRSWIRSSHGGILGGLGLAAAGIPLGPRDRVIGGSADARLATIGPVLTHPRFLALPGVRAKGLAAAVLRAATGRSAEDGAARQGQRPVRVQTLGGPDPSGLSGRGPGGAAVRTGQRGGVRGPAGRCGSHRWPPVGRPHSAGSPGGLSAGRDPCRVATAGPHGSMGTARIPMAGCASASCRGARPGHRVSGPAGR